MVRSDTTNAAMPARDAGRRLTVLRPPGVRRGPRHRRRPRRRLAPDERAAERESDGSGNRGRARRERAKRVGGPAGAERAWLPGRPGGGRLSSRAGSGRLTGRAGAGRLSRCPGGALSAARGVLPFRRSRDSARRSRRGRDAAVADGLRRRPCRAPAIRVPGAGGLRARGGAAGADVALPGGGTAGRLRERSRPHTFLESFSRYLLHRDIHRGEVVVVGQFAQVSRPT